MKPSAPKTITWIIALVLGIASLVDTYLVPIPEVTATYANYMLIAGFALLAIGTSFRGI